MDTERSLRSLNVIRTMFSSTKDAADGKSLKEDFSITILPSFLQIEYDEGVMTCVGSSGASRVTLALVGMSTHLFKVETTLFGIF